MKKMLLIVLTVTMLASSDVYAAQAKKENVLSAQEWDKQVFAQLDDTDKKVVVSIVRPVGELFGQLTQAVDKGGEALINAYAALMMFYQQSAQAVAQRIDAYRNRMPVIKAISIVPNIDDVEEIIQKILPDQPKNEREIKRAINKALRNKKTKEQIKKLLTEKNNQLQSYVKHIESNYKDLIIELDNFALQMQDMLNNMQE